VIIGGLNVGWLFSELLSPWGILGALLAAFVAMRLFSNTFTLDGSALAAFFAAWLAPPLVLLAGSLTLDAASFEGLTWALSLLGGIGTSFGFAAIGVLGFQFFKENF
jgi:hypothetical protein